MAKYKELLEDKIVSFLQLVMVVFSYLFIGGVIIFLLYLVRYSWMNEDAWPHAIAVSSVIIPIFLVYALVLTLVFEATIVPYKGNVKSYMKNER